MLPCDIEMVVDRSYTGLIFNKLISLRIHLPC